MSHEGDGIGEENVPQLQGDPQEARGAGDLQGSAAQATAGLDGCYPFWLEN
jgi:hypothetical protein